MTLEDLTKKYEEFTEEINRINPNATLEDIKFSRFREWLKNNE